MPRARSGLALIYSLAFLCHAVMAADTIAVNIDPSASNRFQTMEGWGTSLAWYANVIGGIPGLRDRVSDLIFGTSNGLGFNIARYNIGGGRNPHPESVDQSGCIRKGADMPGYWPKGPNGDFDWSQDANQRYMLQAAKSRGANVFEAFSNSPPYWMTVSGSVTGNQDPSKDNLKREHQTTFARYLTEVVQHFAQNWGITFRTLTPFNEPSTKYWKLGGRQEGCHFDRNTQVQMLRALHDEMQHQGLFKQGVSISAADETSIDDAVQTFMSYGNQVKEVISQLNTHSYQGSERFSLFQIARSSSKRLWMSEYATGADGSAIKDIRNGLALATRILTDLRDMKAQAWVYWQAVEDADEGNTWGLMQIPFQQRKHGDPYPINIGKQYYVMGQFSRFIQQNYIILGTNDKNTIAAISPGGETMIAVVVNTDNNWKTVSLGIKSFLKPMIDKYGTNAALNIQTHRTSASENLAQVRNEKLSVDRLFNYVHNAYSAPSSVTTYRISVSPQNSGFVDQGNGKR